MSTLTIALLFSSISAQFNLPPDLLSSLCYIESKHNINVVHYDDGGSDSIGICQIKFETAKSLGFTGTQELLMNPRINIFYAAKYLDYQRRRYHGSISKAIVAYNRGNANGLTYTEYSYKVIKQWRGLASEY